MTNNNFSLSANNSYSQALYELTEEENSKDQVEEEAQALLKLLSVSQEFRNLIKDPRTTQIDQMNVIKAIFEKYKFKDIFIVSPALAIPSKSLITSIELIDAENSGNNGVNKDAFKSIRPAPRLF